MSALKIARRIACAAGLACGLSAAPLAAADCVGLGLTPDQQSAALLHGPWPPAMAPDPSNRVSGAAAAVDLGAALFFDPALSRDGTMSCASCHDPGQDFADGRARAEGRATLDRNSQSLWNVRFQRWFGWAGDTDNLWAQSLTPIVSAAELGHSPETLKAALLQSPHSAAYAGLFGDPAGQDPVLVLVNIAKALSAYQETLVTGQTPFDRFRDALERGDCAAAAAYPEPARRGLALFVDRGKCQFCHSGPLFSNGEFHDAGVPYYIDQTRVDSGRHAGLKALLASPFTLDGAYSDDPARSGAWAVRQVRPSHADFGIFRTPSLRNVAGTAPYMHHGRLADLGAVMRHYSEIDLERMHADGEAILAPLGLTDGEIRDLVAFLESLSAP